MTAPAQASAPQKKPHLALAVATCFGLGYIPKAPGTAGSLLGVFIALLSDPGFLWWSLIPRLPDPIILWMNERPTTTTLAWAFLAVALMAAVGFVGVLAAGKTSKYSANSDPPSVVIDEVSGQHLTLLAGGAWLLDGNWIDDLTAARWWDYVNWKYLLLGFILFRVFDIWKPFPVRQAEKLPGGWGIMADDWVAGIYAALGLWLARALGM